jgi:two-component system, OmpR family, phosphate regulon response regulator PhoB
VPRILIVDDDLAILRLLEVNFRMDGFDVDTAAHGEEALAAASNAAPDVVILDLMMPGMDGREIFDRLRSLPETAGVPVIFLSARGRDDALVGVAAMYVQKPFDTVKLVETAKSLVEGSGR